MTDLRKYFNKVIDLEKLPPPSPPSGNDEHSVIVHFNSGIDELEEVHKLEDKLVDCLKDSNVGWWDGHEVAMDNSEGWIFLYGRNAESLFKKVQPILENSNLMKGAIANLRFGPPEGSAPEINIEI